MTNQLIVRSVAALAVLALIALAVLPFLAFAENGSDKDKSVKSAAWTQSGTSVNISNDGRVLVRGALIESRTGSEIVARTTWDDTSVAWRIRTDGDTDFVTRSQGSSSLDEMENGDMLSFSGVLDDGSFAVDASVVKNWSVDDEIVSYRGSIESINASDTSFVLSTKSGDIEVDVTGDTAFSRNDFDSLDEGDTVSVSGNLDGDDRIVASKITFEVKKTAGKQWESFSNWFRGAFSFGNHR